MQDYKTVLEQSMFDKLDYIMYKQKIFTEKIYKPYDLNYKKQPFNCYNFTKERFDVWYTLMRAGTELHEAAELIHSKIWSHNIKPFDKYKILEELIDVQKFVNQAINMLGFNARDIYEMHENKGKVNDNRQSSGKY